MKNIKNEIEYRKKIESDNWNHYEGYDTDYYSDYLNEEGYSDFEKYAITQRFNRVMQSIYKKNHIREDDFNLLSNEVKFEYFKDALELYLNNQDYYHNYKEDKWMEFLLKKSFMNKIKEVNNDNLDDEVFDLLDINNREHLINVEQDGEKFIINVDIYSYALLFREDEVKNIIHHLSVFNRLSSVERVLRDVKFKGDKILFCLEDEYKMFGKNEVEQLFQILLNHQLSLEAEYEYKDGLSHIYVDKDEIESLICNFFREKILLEKISSIDNVKEVNSIMKRKI